MTTVIPFLALLTLLSLPTLAASLHGKHPTTFRPHLSHALVALLLSGLTLLLGPSPSAFASSSHALGNKGASLLQGQSLNGDDYLESPNGQYVALMQDDGNFVLYHVSSTGSFTNPYWSTLTSIGQKGFAAMQTDGNLVLYHGTSSTPGTPYWASNTNAGAGSYHLDLQSDGDLVLYNGNGAGAPAPWASNTVFSVSGLEQQMFMLINQARTANGRPPLTWNGTIANVARAHSNLMASGCGSSHQCSGEPPFSTRLSNAGVHWISCGEDVGYEPGTPTFPDAIQTLETAFLNSPGHRANLLDSSYTQEGVGVSIDSQSKVWVTVDLAQI